MIIFKPSKYEDVREITDEVKTEEQPLSIERLDKENAKRVLDLCQVAFML